jgi:hypothetical protein
MQKTFYQLVMEKNKYQEVYCLNSEEEVAYYKKKQRKMDINL